MDSALHFSTVLAAFFAIMNPIANTPLFLSLTDGLEPRARRLVAVQAVLFAFAIVAVFTLGGATIFSVFGITLPAFRIAGGLLVAQVGYRMLQGESSKVHHPHSETADDEAALGIAISPLALPVLAGPGTIATAMSFTGSGGASDIARVLGAFGIVCLVTWMAFVAGGSLVKFLGQHFIQVVTRLMGLVLAVVGVQMLIAGIQGVVAAS